MKRLLSIFFVIAIVCSFGSVSFAQSTSGQQTINTQTLNGAGYVDNTTTMSNQPGVMSNEEAKTISKAGLPSVTADQASSFFEKKGFDIVGILQTMVQPFAVIIFIGCSLMTLVGAFGNSQLVGKGLVGMMIACIMYAVVLYAPELLDFFMGWVRE
jgi:hypothetical protein